MEDVRTTPAIMTLFLPLWEDYGEGETLEEFVEAFFQHGGRVNVAIEAPNWLKKRMEDEEQDGFELPDEEDYYEHLSIDYSAEGDKGQG